MRSGMVVIPDTVGIEEGLSSPDFGSIINSSQTKITHSLSNESLAYLEVGKGMLELTSLMIGQSFRLPRVNVPKVNLRNFAQSAKNTILKVDDIALQVSTKGNSYLNQAKRKLIKSASKKITSKLSFGSKRQIIKFNIRKKVKDIMIKEHQIINSENFIKALEAITKAKKVRGGI